MSREGSSALRDFRAEYGHQDEELGSGPCRRTDQNEASSGLRRPQGLGEAKTKN